MSRERASIPIKNSTIRRISDALNQIVRVRPYNRDTNLRSSISERIPFPKMKEKKKEETRKKKKVPRGKSVSPTRASSIMKNGNGKYPRSRAGNSSRNRRETYAYYIRGILLLLLFFFFSFPRVEDKWRFTCQRVARAYEDDISLTRFFFHSHLIFGVPQDENIVKNEADGSIKCFIWIYFGAYLLQCLLHTRWNIKIWGCFFFLFLSESDYVFEGWMSS